MPTACNHSDIMHCCHVTFTSAGVKLTLSGLIDGKNVNGGGHRIGLGFELEAWSSDGRTHEEPNGALGNLQHGFTHAYSL